jgi:hypothetical protein
MRQTSKCLQQRARAKESSSVGEQGSRHKQEKKRAGIFLFPLKYPLLLLLLLLLLVYLPFEARLRPKGQERSSPWYYCYCYCC